MFKKILDFLKLILGIKDSTMSFPSSPTNGQLATVNNIRYQYDSTTNYWARVATPMILSNTFNTITENVTANSGAISGTTTFYLANGSILTYSTNTAANWTANVTYSSSTTLNTYLSANQALSFSLVVTNGATAYYQNGFQIDGTSVTPKWQGGTAPTAGNASATDVYSFTIIKTSATPTYTVLGSLSKFV